MAKPALDDLLSLRILHLVEEQRLGVDEVAQLCGVTRGTVAGLVHRTRLACAAEDARALTPADLGYGGGPVVKPANMDGGMWPLWWMHSKRPRKAVRA
jgi:hypothetical protein